MAFLLLWLLANNIINFNNLMRVSRTLGNIPQNATQAGTYRYAWDKLNAGSPRWEPLQTPHVRMGKLFHFFCQCHMGNRNKSAGHKVCVLSIRDGYQLSHRYKFTKLVYHIWKANQDRNSQACGKSKASNITYKVPKDTSLDIDKRRNLRKWLLRIAAT